MTVYEVDKLLEQGKLVFLVDTREQETSSLVRRLAELGEYRREKLDFGDYSVELQTEDGTYSLKNIVSVERKMSLDEISQNFTKGRDRFEREFERMKKTDQGKMFLLIEGGSFSKIFNHQYTSKFSPNCFIASLITFMVRYNVAPIFCHPNDTATMIYKLLRYELRERLLTDGRVDKATPLNS